MMFVIHFTFAHLYNIHSISFSYFWLMLAATIVASGWDNIPIFHSIVLWMWCNFLFRFSREIGFVATDDETGTETDCI